MERSGSDRRPPGGGKPGGGSRGRSGGKPSGRSSGKPDGRSSGSSGGRSGDRDQRGLAKRSTGGRPGGQSGGKSYGSGGSRPAGKPRETRDPNAPRPDRGPALPEGIDVEDLDPAVLNELRTLPEDLREKVGGHLVAAEWALLDEDTDLARKHAEQAKRLAGRVASVREAMGIVAYRCGDYAEALAELRAVRRISGDDSFVPMMADCERGLGRPERALELLREVRDASPEVKVEAALVAAGARSDMGQHEAALVLLDVPELKSLPPGDVRARLEYAYADTLAHLGRDAESREWFAKAAASDIDEVTDAAERLA